jgi:hypothetical protein
LDLLEAETVFSFLAAVFRVYGGGILLYYTTGDTGDGLGCYYGIPIICGLAMICWAVWELNTFR